MCVRIAAILGMLGAFIAPGASAAETPGSACALLSSTAWSRTCRE
jgi:hypothetical protein